MAATTAIFIPQMSDECGAEIHYPLIINSLPEQTDMDKQFSSRFDEFESRLSEILGQDLAKSLVAYSTSGTRLNGHLLQGDGIQAISAAQRENTLALIAEFTARADKDDGR